MAETKDTARDNLVALEQLSYAPPLSWPRDPVTGKKKWETPHLIKSTINQTETGAGPGTDGLGAITS